MKFLQNVFQVVGKKPVFLVLFMFVFLGSECDRETKVTGGNGSPKDTEEALSEQQAKVEAAERAAEEARKRAEAARQAGDGDAAKAAEEERKQKEAEVEKQRQIQTALQSAASAALRAYEAVKRVASAKKQVEETTLASYKPFPGLEEAVNAAEEKADEAFAAAAQAEEVSVAFDQAEEVALAANQADQQAQMAEEFVSRFQNRFTFHSHEKALFPSDSDKTSDPQFGSQCKDFLLQELFQSMPPDLKPLSYPAYSGCHLVKGGSSHYNCFCVYEARFSKTWFAGQDKRIFYRKQ